MGHVCKRHEVFVPTNESCRWCDPPMTALALPDPYPPRMVIMKGVIPKIKGLTEKIFLLKDPVENPRIVKCHCGQWEFDRLQWPPNVVMESPDSRHTPGRCLFVDEVVDWYGESVGASALRDVKKLQELEKRYPPSRYRMCRCGEIMFNLLALTGREVEAFTKHVHHTPDACVQRVAKEHP